ncbi:3-oxoadipate enol-lactonase [Gordonia sp. TBRC 11910]|uniref:3-oxoadipate enol-lactonase n=1 Tax=Gordonia asplenii TaxID=2725283 RepID=A0A848KX81_9ACTN|nr:3-oxoadipate enol-lactonase [Gordonia asplenii]NMO02852.1 3-oxoadipate enol-lactonase [Gordonia asplenii]
MSAVEVHAVLSGRPDAPTVVLSNSLGSDHRMWDPQLAALEEHFRVIRYDTRGHGASPVPDGPYSIDDVTDDLIALLDRFDVTTAHFVGLSLGGMTMMRAAARNPERVDRLAVLCTSAALPAARQAYVERAAQVRAEGTAAVAQGVVSRWFTADYLAAHPDRRSYFEQMVAETPAEGYAGCCELLAAMDITDDLPHISAPTLVIAGADDVATPPEMLATIADTVADGTLLVVPQACHLANNQQPQTITPAIVNHLRHFERA